MPPAKNEAAPFESEPLTKEQLLQQQNATRSRQFSPPDSAASPVQASPPNAAAQKQLETPVAPSVDPTRVSLYDVHIVDARHLFAAGDGGVILSSRNDGETWRPRETGMNDRIVGIALDGENGVAVSAGGVIVRTSDGGATWQRTSTVTGSARSIARVGDAHWLVLGDRRSVIVSPRGAETIVSSLPLDAAAASGTVVVAVGPNGTVAMSADVSGEVEAQWPEGERPDLVAVTFAGPHPLLAATSSGAVYASDQTAAVWRLVRRPRGQPIAPD